MRAIMLNIDKDGKYLDYTIAVPESDNCHNLHDISYDRGTVVDRSYGGLESDLKEFCGLDKKAMKEILSKAAQLIKENLNTKSSKELVILQVK